jgi:rhomboid protease GluP
LLALASFVFWSDLGHAGEWMTGVPEKVFHGREYWRPWTALLAHADPGHLLSNCVLFFAFAYLLYGHFGPVAFPLAPFLLGGVTNLIVLTTLPAQAELLGVSGVVYWMGGAWLTLYSLLETRDRRSVRFLKAMGVGVVLFIPETIRVEVSYLSHFVGFVLGVAWALVHYRLNRARYRRAEVIEVRLEEPVPFDYE